MSTAAIFATIVLLGISYQYARAFIFSPLKDIPGPKFAAMSDIWMLYQVLQGRGSFKIYECFQKYGDVVRIGPTSVACRRPEDYREIYISHKYRKDHNMAKLVVKGHMNLISAVDPEKHGKLRKMTNPLFTSESIKTLEKSLRQTLDDLCARIDPASENKEPIDMWPVFRFFAYDFFGAVAFGKSFGALKTGVIEFMDDMDRFFLLLAIKTSLPPPLFNALHWVPIPRIRNVLTSEDRLFEFSTNLLRKYSDEDMTGRCDMIARLYNAIDPLTNEPLSESAITSTLLIYVLAGTDTTSTTFSWIIWALACDQRVYDKLRAELEVAIPDPNNIPDNAALKRIPYLSAVIKEALRRWPPASLYTPRVVPPGGAVHGGYFIPEGTSIGCTSYAMHRNEEHFPDPEAFIPERWVETEDGVTKAKLNPPFLASYMAWLIGPRNCQGQPMAEMELYGLVSTVVRRYKFKPAEGMNEETMKERETILLQPQGHSLKLLFEKNW